MIKEIITEDGKIAIPEVIRKKLGLIPGTVLVFDEDRPGISVKKAVDVERMRSVIGCAAEAMEGKTAEEWLEWMRGPVELPPEDASR